jgi:hypothetical protein
MLHIRRWSGHEGVCLDCNQTWKQYDRFHLWPIRLGWAGNKRLSPNKKFFASWGIENGIGKRVGDRQFNQTLRVGLILIKFGPDLAKLWPYDRDRYIAYLEKKVKHFKCKHVGFKHVRCEHRSEEAI